MGITQYSSPNMFPISTSASSSLTSSFTSAYAAALPPAGAPLEAEAAFLAAAFNLSAYLKE